ncbi:hypothetical protein AVEN_166218-1 [Araneus ventricosus]|uniref:Uncharacterized protein n=1 Tax=Araneus ventricosus TaxID=182803 RepID=A0A4Y2UM78_ARAVE|nr:hypothetical protein AVEN_166218-1 [Araneus ventricosus]
MYNLPDGEEWRRDLRNCIENWEISHAGTKSKIGTVPVNPGLLVTLAYLSETRANLSILLSGQLSSQIIIAFEISDKVTSRCGKQIIKMSHAQGSHILSPFPQKRLHSDTLQKETPAIF